MIKIEELDLPHYIDKELIEDYWIARKFVDLLNPSHCEGLHGILLDFHTRRLKEIERILLGQDRTSDKVDI